MNFGFSEDQDMIRKSARDLVRGESSMERIREMQASEDGYSRDLWRQMADAGWLGAVYPEEYGGIGLGYVDLICIEEEFGRGLMPEPLITTVLLGGNAVLFGGTEEQKSEILPLVAAGELTMTLGAYELEGRFNLAHVATTAKEKGSGYVLNGSKAFVPDAATSDKIVVTARTSGGTSDEAGITLFLLDRDTPGLTLTPVTTMDHRPRATVELKDVSVDASAVLGAPGEALNAVEKVIDRATVALCAELVGIIEQSLSMSTEYAQERIQFDKPIGSFQAIKFKCADMFVDLEIARSSMYYAAMAIDEDMPDLRTSVSAAKTLCCDGAVSVTKEAIQIHGGIGFTEEHDIHLFYKRAMAAAVTFGDSAYHRERYIQEKGFGQGERALAAAEA